MTTERDVYEIETKTAVANVNELANAMDDAGKEAKKQKTAMEEMAGFLDSDLKQAIFSAQAAYNLLSQAVGFAVSTVREGVHDVLEAQAANMRLSVALKNAGGASADLVRALQVQNSALQRATGIDDDYLTSIQAMLTTMGVAPEMLGRFTEAAVNLSIATGQDAKVAAQQLARANAEGREDLKRYGIELDDAAFAARGFEVVLEAVEQRFGGLAESQPSIIRQTNELTGAWSDFKEALGGAALRLVETENGANGAAKALDWLTSQIEAADVKTLALTAGLTNLINPLLVIPNLLSKAGAALAGDTPAPATTPGPGKPSAAEVELSIGDPVVVSRQLGREREAAYKKAIADKKAYNEEMERVFINGSSNLKKLEDEENHKMMERITKQGDWEVLNEEERVRAAAQASEDYIAVLKWEEEQRQQLRDKQLEAEKQHWDNVKSTAKAALESLVASQIQFVGDMLMQNTEFNRRMFEMELQRKTAGMAEADVQKERAAMEKQLAAERGNAYLKMTGDALMSIAQQASVKAVMEGVEAIASLATGNPAAAALHGTAAAGYAGVAVLAGGTAAVLSSARGLTSDERKQLESASNNEKERKQKEASQRAEGKVVEGTVVNVYNLGITGQTDVEQAKELDRIRSKYADLRTGSNP